jgi:hypothetical protein
MSAEKQLVQGPACVWKEWLPFATAEIIEHQRHAEANHARMIMGLSMDVMHPYPVHLSLTFELITWLTLTCSPGCCPSLPHVGKEAVHLHHFFP